MYLCMCVCVCVCYCAATHAHTHIVAPRSSCYRLQARIHVLISVFVASVSVCICGCESLMHVLRHMNTANSRGKCGILRGDLHAISTLQDRLFVGCWNPPTGCYDWYDLLHKKSKNDTAVNAWAGNDALVLP